MILTAHLLYKSATILQLFYAIIREASNINLAELVTRNYGTEIFTYRTFIFSNLMKYGITVRHTFGYKLRKIIPFCSKPLTIHTAEFRTKI